MSKSIKYLIPKKVLHHLGTVLVIRGKNTDPINLEIDPSNALIILVHFVFQDIFI